MYAVVRSTSVARLDLWNSFVATKPPKITRAGMNFFRSISFTKSGFSRFTTREYAPKVTAAGTAPEMSAAAVLP